MPIATIARHVPWSFFGRLGLAFAEIVLAASTLVGSVILGHELKEWRAWYADPGTEKPWAPTPKPSAMPPVDEPR
jgi:hypothetical protein